MRRYVAICYYGEFDYVPKLYSVIPMKRSSYLEQNGNDMKLDFNKGPTANMCGFKFKQPFHFYDFNLGPIYTKMNHH